jgi:hypothetical protein
LSLLFLIGVFGAFGAMVSFTLGEWAFERWPSLWGVGLLLAAGVNWWAGSKINGRAPYPLRGRLRDRLFYRAHHKFLSFPMEMWSAPLALFALVLIVAGLVPRAPAPGL